jgi:molybdenum cofactor synthesis domain-containing protein
MTPVTVAILTVSDSSAEGTRPDTSGPALVERCHELGWPVVDSAVIPDDENLVLDTLIHWADSARATVILTTGGTGIAPRDVTPEATRRALHREIPGLGELLRSEGRVQTPFSVLSRALVGMRSKSLIANLPGSPRGALFSFNVLVPLIPHIVNLLDGHTQH